MLRIKKLLLLMAFGPALAWAIDLQPNDIVAPLPNKNYVTVSYLNTENNTLYRNGAAATGNPVIDTQSAIFRATRTYEMGSLPAASFIQLPYGNIKPGGSLANQASDTGVGDLTFATAIWPYSNRSTRTYFGLAAYLISPTGSYSSQRMFNVSENRFRTDLQMGFQTPITSNVDGMIAVDTMWFGGNSQCGIACTQSLTTTTSLNQKPLTTTQLGPIYRINQIFTVAASYFYVAGGATSINNTYRNDVTNTQRFLLSGQAHTPIGRLSLQYGRDMEIKNGFVQTRLLAVRLMKEF